MNNAYSAPDLILQVGNLRPDLIKSMNDALDAKGSFRVGVGMDAQPFVKEGRGLNPIEKIKKSMAGGDTDAMVKALTETLTDGSMTDLTNLQDGRAITVESVDPTLVKIIDTQPDFVFGKMLKSSKVNSILDMYNEMNDIGHNNLGGFTFGMSMGEVDIPPVADLSIDRKYKQVKFLRTQRRLSEVMTRMQTYPGQDAMKLVDEAGALDIARGREETIIYGNSSIIPNQFDGLFKLIKDWDTAYYPSNDYKARKSLILDYRESDGGEGGYADYDMFTELAIRANRNRGASSHFFGPFEIFQHIDQTFLQNIVRFNANYGSQQNTPRNGFIYGQPVAGITVSGATGGEKGGQIDFVPHRYLRAGDDPERDYFPAAATRTGATVANGGPDETAISSTTAAANSPSTLHSNFKAGDVGDYYYFVVPINEYGAGTRVGVPDASLVSPYNPDSAVSVAEGEVVTLTINHTNYASSAIRGFLVYRSQVDATGYSDDGSCRHIGEIWLGNNEAYDTEATVTSFSATATSTTFVDRNDKLPGTAEAFCLDLVGMEGGQSLDIRQLLDITRIELPFAFGNVMSYSWVYNLYMYLRMRKGSNIYIRNLKLDSVDNTFRA